MELEDNRDFSHYLAAIVPSTQLSVIKLAVQGISPLVKLNCAKKFAAWASPAWHVIARFSVQPTQRENWARLHWLGQLKRNVAGSGHMGYPSLQVFLSFHLSKIASFTLL